MFDVMRQQDVLLHHPYESFSSVLDLLQLAAADPNVVAIKQTVYRTGNESLVMEALDAIAEKGCDELWLNPGTYTPEVLERAEQLGLNAICGCSIIDVGVSPSSL